VDVVIVPMVAASRARSVQAGGGAYQWMRGRARWCRRLLEGRHKVARLYSVRQSVGGQEQGGAGQERARRTRVRRRAVEGQRALRGDGVAAGGAVVRQCSVRCAVKSPKTEAAGRCGSECF
jgi:hypothetical protein